MKKLIVLWLVLLVLVAATTLTLTLAQAPRDAAPVVSGADLGFRLTFTGNGEVTGAVRHARH